MNDDRERQAQADDDDHTEAILAADDTGLVRNEVTIVQVELREGESLPPV